MKKIFTSIIAIFVVLSMYNVTFAADGGASASLELTSSIDIKSKTVVVTLSTKELNNITGTSVMGYEAYLDYDKDIFTSVKIEGLNDWDVTVNREEDGYFALETGNTPNVLPNQGMAKFTFTIKDNLETVDTTIELKNMELTEGDPITFTNGLKVNVKMNNVNEGISDEGKNEAGGTKTPSDEQKTNTDDGTSDKDNNQKNDEDNIDENKDNIVNENINNENTSNTLKKEDTTTTSTKTLPKTGANKIAAIILISVFIAIICLAKYKSVKTK